VGTCNLKVALWIPKLETLALSVPPKPDYKLYPTEQRAVYYIIATLSFYCYESAIVF